MQEINVTDGVFGTFRPADNKHPRTGYYLSDQEYEALVNRINAAEYNVTVFRKEYDRQFAELTAEHQQTVKDKENDKQELALRITELESAISREKDLNRNLLRICRERANSDRNLRPKKGHSGYLILSAQQKIRKVKQGREYAEEQYWEARIQTPYPTELPSEQVEQLVITEVPIEDLLGTHTKQKLLLKANYQAGYWECIYSYNIDK